MTNLECAISVLAAHREARRWADEAVAVDLLARLGMDGAAEVGGAPAIDQQSATNDGSAPQV